MKILIIALLALASAPSWSQTWTSVLACDHGWGANSGTCGGCEVLSLQAPATDLLVQTPSDDFWKKLADVPDAALVSVSAEAAGPIVPNSSSNACAKAAIKVQASKVRAAIVAAPPPGDPNPPTDPNPVGGVAEIKLNWQMPTMNTDGSVLPASSISGYKIYYGTSIATLDQSVTSPGPLTTDYTISGLPSGQYFIQMTTLTANDESNRTNMASVMVNAAAPPDKVLKVSDPTLYRIVQNLTATGQGDLVVIPFDRGTQPFGTVPLATPCDAGQSIVTHGITYYRVNTNSPGLQFLGNNHPSTVYAVCTLQ